MSISSDFLFLEAEWLLNGRCKYVLRAARLILVLTYQATPQI